MYYFYFYFYLFTGASSREYGGWGRKHSSIDHSFDTTSNIPFI